MAQKIASPFEFNFEGKTLSGLIEKPQHQKPKALVIIVPGYGRTDFVEGNWFGGLRDKLVAAGLTVCFWDKMGCGESEGVFNAQQPVGNSANEVVAAIKTLKHLQVAGSEKIGIWGISRAGWICPLVNAQFPIDFWVSVSGTDDKENFGYLLKSNLIIAGKSDLEVKKLYQAWKQGHKIYCTGGSYGQYLKAIRPLMNDSLCQQLFGYSPWSEVDKNDTVAYKEDQQVYTNSGHFDEESGLWVYLEDFESVLSKIECPVLALFGAQDSQVDWVKTKKLYEQTLGSKSNSLLTTKVFDQCNHNLQQCVTCAYQEDLSANRWQACDQYYETIITWLAQQKII